MGTSSLPVADVSASSKPWLRTPVSKEFGAAVCIAPPLAILLCYPSVAMDAWLLWSIFRDLALVFFALIVVRHLLRPGQLSGEGRSLAEPEAKQRTGLLVALGAGALAYAGTLPLYFICDDFDVLDEIRRPFLTGLWPELTSGQFDGHTHIFYRPLAWASLFVDYRLWHNWATGYHLTNVGLHLLAIAGVFYLCKQLRLSHQSSVAAALIFAVLPVNVQAVTWMSTRCDLLATSIGVWSLACAAGFRKTRRPAYYAMALLCFVLAVCSKESAYVIPILWLALELIPWDGTDAGSPLAKRFLLGYVALPILMLVHRFLTLGGLGGYYTKDGAPVAQHFQLSSLAGILVRAPAEALFGYNWLQPHGWMTAVAAASTAAILLTMAVLAKTSSTSRCVVWFSLIWVMVAPLPAHFYFVVRDPGLFFSRAMYFGSIGVAILVGTLLAQTFPSPKACRAWTVVLVLLLFAGGQHNAAAWRDACRRSRSFQAQLHRTIPSPPPGVTLYIQGVPKIVRGVPFFTVGLPNAVRFSYGWRADIEVRAAEFEPRLPPADATHIYLHFQ